MINIAKLLKDAPKGTKLYSPLFGEVTFKYLNGSKFGIVVEDFEECCRSFDKYGRYFTNFPNAECLLFPSKDCRTWEGWTPCVESKFKDGDVLVTTKIRNCPFIYHKPCYDDGCAYYYVGLDGRGNLSIGCFRKTPELYLGLIEDAIPATKEQRDLLFKKIKEAGYEWDERKKELRKIQPHYDIANFKPFDKVLVRDNDRGKWRPSIFSYHIKGRQTCYPFCCIGNSFSQCIPFEGNEHLLGTTDMCDERFINW